MPRQERPGPPTCTVVGFLGRRCASVIDPGCDKCPAASNAFRVEVGVVFGYACPSERAHKSPSRTAHDRPGHRPGSRSYQPARSYDWSDTGYCGSDSGAPPGILGRVRRTILAVSVVDVI